MATSKSTRAPRKSPVKQSSNDAEFVEVPFLKGPSRMVAPAVDPYLKPGSVTAETISFGEVALPPILSGIQEGQDLQGRPVDYPVRVIHVSRRQIDSVLRAIENAHPELEPVQKVVSSWMCGMDTMRDEAKFGLGCTMSWLKGETPNLEKALEQLNAVVEMLGHWHDERRLHLR